ncbi:MAG TPA: PadR family transcriptional regulator [Acidimicrobiales bacterium]|nr:PadR family transcriptional regulator [Acidimicrobiales bacterium]
MAARTRSNPLALAVLVCLLERPMHPYEMAQTLRERGKHESIKLNYGSLYGVVESLEAKGLIRAGETVREGRRPERTIYEITDAGAIELIDWLTELVAVPTKEYLKFEAALTFLPALGPDQAVELLKTRTQALEMMLAQRRGTFRLAADKGLPRLFLLEGEYETCLLEAELEWVQLLVKDIETGALEGLEEWRSFDAGAPGTVQTPPQD